MLGLYTVYRYALNKFVSLSVMIIIYQQEVEYVLHGIMVVIIVEAI